MGGGWNPSNSGMLYPKLSGGLSEKEGTTESLKALANILSRK